MAENTEQNFSTLDPLTDREKYKAQIIEKVHQHFEQENLEEIRTIVDKQYDDLLKNASVLMHIPALTQGAVMSYLRYKQKVKNESE